VILDMGKLNQVLWAKPGLARVQAGAKLMAIDKHTREMGWEIRMAPSTYRTATIGGSLPAAAAALAL
jgi:FAD/FMN-containing dehydrogenase